MGGQSKGRAVLEFEEQRALPVSFAEGKGFEPLVRGYRTLVFKTSSIGRSDNLPH